MEMKEEEFRLSIRRELRKMQEVRAPRRTVRDSDTQTIRESYEVQ